MSEIRDVMETLLASVEHRVYLERYLAQERTLRALQVRDSPNLRDAAVEADALRRSLREKGCVPRIRGDGAHERLRETDGAVDPLLDDDLVGRVHVEPRDARDGATHDKGDDERSSERDDHLDEIPASENGEE